MFRNWTMLEILVLVIIAIMTIEKNGGKALSLWKVKRTMPLLPYRGGGRIGLSKRQDGVCKNREDYASEEPYTFRTGEDFCEVCVCIAYTKAACDLSECEN